MILPLYHQLTEAEQDRVVEALVPLSEMFGYATSVRSATQGRATFTMQFDHYAEVPNSISEEIKAKVGASSS